MADSKPIWLLVFLAVQLTGQVPDKDLEMEIESIAENNEEDESDLVQLAEYVQQLKQDPVEVNFASMEELQELPYLNIFQVNNLLQYRQRTGKIYTPYELMAVKGFDRELIEKTLPFLSFQTEKTVPQIKPRQLWLYSRHNIIARASQNIEQRQGFKEDYGSPYLGNPQAYYLRYRGTYRRLVSVGLVAQHDPGEPLGGEYQKSTVDHLSGHIALTDYGPIKTFIAGDYQAEFGQGLALWTGLAFGKSSRSTEIKRFARGFRAFTGSEENRFLRGMAVTWRIRNSLDLSAFYSSKSVDANLELDESSQTTEMVSSLQSTGLHRTLDELADKDANHLQVFGTNVTYRGNGFSAGITAVKHRLRLPLMESDQLYRKFGFSGSEISNFSMDANYLFRDLNLFGELASDSKGNLAGVIGLQSNPADGLYMSLLHRNYGKKYQTLYNSPFGESGSYGEKGTYLGFEWEINPTFSWRSYFDIYEFRWLRFRTDAPSAGHDIQTQLDLSFNRFLSSYIRLKYKSSQINSDAESSMESLAPRSKLNLRIHAEYQLSTSLKSASRIEYCKFSQERQNKKGMMLFQEVTYAKPQWPVSFSTRVALIDVGDFYARIYAYERDVTYAFSIPAYYGKALRSYLLVSYDVSDFLQFQARYAVTSFSDRDKISSGGQEIAGNTISEARLQLRLSF